jgi:hypothetical protein
MQSHEEPTAVPPAEIKQQLYHAAASDNFRPGARIPADIDPDRFVVTERSIQLQESIDRAHHKAFVPAIKPLRRLLRNQGAVNDSVIEALYNLAAQTMELVDEQQKLRKRLAMLEQQLREHTPDRQGQP